MSLAIVIVRVVPERFQLETSGISVIGIVV